MWSTRSPVKTPSRTRRRIREWVRANTRSLLDLDPDHLVDGEEAAVVDRLQAGLPEGGQGDLPGQQALQGRALPAGADVGPPHGLVHPPAEGRAFPVQPPELLLDEAGVRRAAGPLAPPPRRFPRRRPAPAAGPGSPGSAPAPAARAAGPPAQGGQGRQHQAVGGQRQRGSSSRSSARRAPARRTRPGSRASSGSPPGGGPGRGPAPAPSARRRGGPRGCRSPGGGRRAGPAPARRPAAGCRRARPCGWARCPAPTPAPAPSPPGPGRRNPPRCPARGSGAVGSSRS